MKPLRVTFVVPYPSGFAPGQRFRFEQWLQFLPDGAVSADVRPLFSESAYARLYQPGSIARKAGHTVSALARRVRDVVAPGKTDVVLLYRAAFPLGPPLLDILLARKVPVVYDFDDAIFLASTSPANRLVSALKVPGKTAAIVGRATATTVGNAHLAAYASRFSDNVVVIPTTLDVDTYRPPADKPNTGILRIGWSGSPTTVPHLESISEALQVVLRRPAVELDVLGAADFALPGTFNMTSRPWQRHTEIADVSAFDIGLMPLPDDDWSKGKCGFKALLYMALGVPVVASPIGVNQEIIEYGVNGLLASTTEEWVEAIDRLFGDESLRRKLAAEGRRTVVERYSGRQWAPKFLEVLEAAALTRSG